MGNSVPWGKAKRTVGVVLAVVVVTAASLLVQALLRLLVYSRPLGGVLQHVVWGTTCPPPTQPRGSIADACTMLVAWDPVWHVGVALAFGAYVLAAPRVGLRRRHAVAVLAGVVAVAYFWPVAHRTHFPAADLAREGLTWGEIYARRRRESLLDLGGVTVAFVGGTLLARALSETDRPVGE